MHKLIVFVVGTRPNFVKVSPLYCIIKERRITAFLIHTGQHYDYELSKAFIEDFSLENPDIDLGVGSANHGEQTGKIMIELEKAVLKEKPDLIVVVGDVNSIMQQVLSPVNY